MRSLLVRGLFVGLSLSSCNCQEPLASSANEPVVGESLFDGGPAGTEVLPPVISEQLGPTEWVIQVGVDVAPAIRERFIAYVKRLNVNVRLASAEERLDRMGPDSKIFSLGKTWTTDTLMGQAADPKADPEGYWIKAGRINQAQVWAGIDAAKKGIGLGNAYAAYALVQKMGARFLHPLAANLPPIWRVPPESFDETYSPRWPVRGFQLHTMHPTELVDLVQGWGPQGPDDLAGFEAMLPEWESFLEWMVANGQSHFHWVLLESEAWAQFAQSDERLRRLTILVERAHAYGLKVGVDVPIVLNQQNAFRLIRQRGELADEIAQMRARVDWLMQMGFDYFATENGTTEFSHPAAGRMIEWMNALSSHVQEKYQKPCYVKIHCSTGQVAKGYLDPLTGQPINFNFLPQFADPRMGIMPHTVQHYGLDDPAPTYGNVNFDYMRQFLRQQVGQRDVLWHPETAYWVSFDVDVPLFLPVYAERRLHDLRLLASDENAGLMGVGLHAGKRMQGQMNFSSGWEWGYWLNDLMAAKAAWNPHLEVAQTEEAFKRILLPEFDAFGPASADWVQLIWDTAKAQHELLILGKVNGQSPSDVTRRNGQAYIQGIDAWDDLSEASLSVPFLPISAQMTQPDRLGLVEMRSPLPTSTVRYGRDVRPLLQEMLNRFETLDVRWANLESRISEEGKSLYSEMRDGMRVTTLRVRQLYGLYEYVDGRNDLNPAQRMLDLAMARKALDDAAVVIAERAKHYRVPLERIAGWRRNPTSYPFGYLWTAHRLLYFWRDEGKAVDAPLSPCYLNVISPTAISIGEGSAQSAAELIQELLRNPANINDLSECIAAPSIEPTFPPLGLRSRP